MGKAYANRKSVEDRPEGDFYATPASLIWVASKYIQKEFTDINILEPCAGKLAIADELKKLNYCVETNDLYMDGCNHKVDYLTPDSFTQYDYVISNPPFSLWDEFVNKSKSHCSKFMYLGRLNYFGTVDRYKSELWKNLKYVLPFNRYVDYRTPYRLDGLFNVGALCTGWFIWDMEYDGLPMVDVLNISQYAKLGQYKT